MSVELKTYGSDRRLELGAAEAIRSPVYLNDWTTIRIGLQYSWDGVASNIAGTPFFGFGVCSGSANVLAAATATHVVGWKTVATTMTHNVGPPAYFSATQTHTVFKKVGSTVTTAAGGATGFTFLNTPAQRAGLFLEITKGSPNFAISLGYSSTTAGTQSNLTDNEFLAIMEMSALTSGSISSVKTGYSVQSAVNLAVSEADGVLDHLFVYWERTSHKFSFNIRHRKIA